MDTNDYYIQSGTLIQQVNRDVFLATWTWRWHNVAVEIQDDYLLITLVPIGEDYFG